MCLLSQYTEINELLSQSAEQGEMQVKADIQN